MKRFCCLVGNSLIALCLSGCGGASKDIPKLGIVSGVVKLDDKPLPNATVTFNPDHSRPSGGITDSQGKYELMFNDRLKGAAIGKHKVRITSGTAMEPEKIPPNYNMQTVLIADVKEGKNDIPFDLKSK